VAPLIYGLRLILSNLDQAESAEHMDLPGFALHQLRVNAKASGR